MAEAGLTPSGVPRLDTRAATAARASATANGDATDLDTGAPPVTVLWIAPGRCEVLERLPERLPEHGFAWVDAHFETPRAWVPTIESISGVSIAEEHLVDAENASHPSHFDATRDYEMIVFRGLAIRPDALPDAPIRIRTRPTVFFLFPRCVLSIRGADSHQVPALRRRLLDAGQFGQRLPTRPDEVMLRILNGMVDRYLDLRQPLTDQLESRERELLDPRRPFRDWTSLLEARRQLRKLENLSEEQLDALQEWRDERLDRRGSDPHGGEWADATGSHAAAGLGGPHTLPPLTSTLEIRVNDLAEHIARVREHARRLEHSVETAVQLHFSATAHRTNQIMRTLTVITAVFMPLTLITGIFGMNFEALPGIHSPGGFWWAMAMMGVIALGMVGFFRTRRYLEESGHERAGLRRGRVPRP